MNYYFYFLFIFLSLISFIYNEDNNDNNICSAEYTNLIINYDNVNQTKEDINFYEESCFFSFKESHKIHKIFSDIMTPLLFSLIFVCIIITIVFIVIIIRHETCTFTKLRVYFIFMCSIFITIGIITLFVFFVISLTKIKSITNNTVCEYIDNDLGYTYNLLSLNNNNLFNDEYNNALKYFNKTFNKFPTSIYKYENFHNKYKTNSLLSDINDEYKSNILFYYNFLINIKTHLNNFYTQMNISNYTYNHIGKTACYIESDEVVEDIKNNIKDYEYIIKSFKIILYVLSSVALIYSLFICILMIIIGCGNDNQYIQKILSKRKTILISLTVSPFALVIFIFLSSIFLSYYGGLTNNYKFITYKLILNNSIFNYKNLKKIIYYKEREQGQLLIKDISIINKYIINNQIYNYDFPKLQKAIKFISALKNLNIGDNNISSEIISKLNNTYTEYQNWNKIVYTYLNKSFNNIYTNNYTSIGTFEEEYKLIDFENKVFKSCLISFIFGILLFINSHLIIMYIIGKEYMINNSFEAYIHAKDRSDIKDNKTNIKDMHFNIVLNVNKIIVHRINDQEINKIK